MADRGFAEGAADRGVAEGAANLRDKIAYDASARITSVQTITGPLGRSSAVDDYESHRIARRAYRPRRRKSPAASCFAVASGGTIRVANTRYKPTSCTDTVTASANST